LLRIFLIVALVTLGQILGGTAAFAENKKAAVVQALQTLSFLPLYVANDEGLFAKHGLDVTVETVGTVKAALGSITSGKAQFSLTAATWPAKAAASGEPIRLIANCVNGPAVWIVGPQEFDFKDLTSLKGQTIISARMPVSTTALLFKAARESGMTPETDFKIIEVKVGSETAALLTLSDQAKFAVVAEPATTWAVTLGSKVLLSFPKSRGNLMASAVAAHKDVDPDIAQRFVDGLQEAMQLIQKDPSKAIAAGQRAFPRLAPEIVEAAVRRMIADEMYPKSVDITPDTFERGVGLYLEKGASLPAFGQTVNRTFIEKAIAAH
jgi:NitT/TauT family transport system substrate-binding protein